MTLEGHLEKLLAVKGVTAAAIVSSSGELLAGKAADPAVIDRLVMLQTAALAAGRALGELIPPPKPAVGEDPADGTSGGSAAGDGSSGEGTSGDATPRGEASAGLGRAAEESPQGGQLMAIYPEGPVLFVPLPAAASMCVVALASPQDVGRARFALRGLAAALAEAARPVA